MKLKKIILFAFLFLLGINANAQKWAYVDTEYILENLPNYREAQSKLDAMARDWQKEIDALSVNLDSKRISLENERVLLTKDLIEERETEINAISKEVEDLQQKRFGAEGDLIAQRKKLVRPIQDQVFNAVQSIAKKKKYGAVFDKSSDLIMLYYNKKYDISDRVLKRIKDM
ncbi:MAG: OmpH family outer membrane protein [Ichthyobacteriaceae bacterium]|nr:OmpH family outer membrane protein [Ichthyobacteriaceae bacterium]